jgi:glycine/D-amino acid oxidase-like deaminating enzyme
MNRTLSMIQASEAHIGASRCEHRAVSKDGRIICRKIVLGENGVSPDLCRTCPFRAVNCSHLRFSLLRTSPSPLLVRFNGRTELWNDEPPEVRFRQAACGVRIVPIEHPDFCTGCSLRQPIQTPPKQPADWRPAALPCEREVPEIRHPYPA